MTPAEMDARWRDHPRDAIALVRAQLDRDDEGVRVLRTHGDADQVIDWLALFAWSWLLRSCGWRQGADPYQVEAAALRYLDELTAAWTEDEAA
jgi:hypothetical protein